jgi:hypothetical protein
LTAQAVTQSGPVHLVIGFCLVLAFALSLAGACSRSAWLLRWGRRLGLAGLILVTLATGLMTPLLLVMRLGGGAHAGPRPMGGWTMVVIVPWSMLLALWILSALIWLGLNWLGRERPPAVGPG